MWMESTTRFIYDAYYVLLIILYVHTDSKLKQKNIFSVK